MIKPDPQFSTPWSIADQRNNAQGPTIETIALGLSVVWLLAAALFFWILPSTDDASGSGGLHTLLLLIALGMPVAMIWLAAVLARTSQKMRSETARLQAALDALAQVPEPATEDRPAPTAQPASRPAGSVSRTEPRARPAPPPPADPDQSSFALEPPEEDPDTPLERADLVRALNFPETADDHEGFAALRHALKNRQAARLIQAAEDILTLLSQDGIYMDDLHPDMARPEIWRQFAAGTRGRAISALGGVRERAALEIAEQRLKEDPIFRDVAHHFLRRFDRMFTEFETEASDIEISSLSETRTARAFMLLGRVAGTFD